MSRTPDEPGHFLRAWRKFADLTLEEVAPRVGMTHQNLGKIERGKVPYSETLLVSLAKIYEAKPVDLISRNPTDPDGLWAIWDDLGPGERTQVVEIAKTFRRSTRN